MTFLCLFNHFNMSVIVLDCNINQILRKTDFHTFDPIQYQLLLN